MNNASQEQHFSHDYWVDKLAAIATNEDRQAFAELFDYFAPKIKAYMLTGKAGYISPEAADELVQESMIKVWRKAASYHPMKARVSTWIFTIARNCRIDSLRRSRPEISLDTDDIWVDMTSDETPLVSLQQQRSQRIVQEQLEQLPDEQRQVLYKVYMEGKSHSEIADDMDLPLGTVKSRVRLAMKKLALTVDR